MKTTIEVNGEVIEIDLENLTEEEAKKYKETFGDDFTKRCKILCHLL